MPHEVDASGQPIKRHARQSPRTVGKTTDPKTGEVIEFQKFGTQQLKFIDPAQPALGVRQLNVGQPFKGFTTSIFPSGFFGSSTLRPTTSISGAVGTSATTPPPFPNGNGEECDLGCWITGRGCDCGCKDVKPCTTCDSSVCAECNAWDLQCEDCKKKDGTCTTPEPCDLGCLLTGRGCECNDNGECDFWDIGCKVGSWWDKYGIIVMIIGGLIGLGFVLWLLRPLFGMIGAFKGGAP